MSVGAPKGAKLTLSAAIRQVFLMTWLWEIFAGFYLAAYVFWVPRLFASFPVEITAGVVTFVLGACFLLDGFEAALELQTSSQVRQFPLRRARRLVGGVVLLGYLLVYLPPQGRIVAHWPLDLAITVLSGVMMVAYGVTNT